VRAYTDQVGEEVPRDRKKVVELFDIQRTGVCTLYDFPGWRAKLSPAYRNYSVGGSRGPLIAGCERLSSRLEAIFTDGDIVPALSQVAKSQSVELRMAVEALKNVWRSYAVVEPQLDELLAAHQVEMAIREGLTAELPRPQPATPLHVFETLGSICGIDALEMSMPAE